MYKVKVRGVKPINEVEFTLDKPLLILGPNGSGKTTLLLLIYSIVNAWAKEARLKEFEINEEFERALALTFKRSIEGTFKSDIKELGEGEVVFENEVGRINVTLSKDVNVRLSLNREVKFNVKEVEDEELPVGEIRVNTKDTEVEVIYGSKGKEKYAYFELLKGLIKDVESSAVINAFLDFYFSDLRPAVIAGEERGEVVIEGKRVAITDYGVFIDGKKYPVISSGLKRLAEILLSARKGRLVLVDDVDAYLDEKSRRILVEELKDKRLIVTGRDKSLTSLFENVVEL